MSQNYRFDGDGNVLGITPVYPDDFTVEAETGTTAVVDPTKYETTFDTTTGACAATLADGSYVGQLKLIHLIVDGGDVTLTPATFADGTTLTFADAGDYALLMWTGSSGWTVVNRGLLADNAGPTTA